MTAARGIAAVDDDPSEFLARVQLHPLLRELAAQFDCRIDRMPTGGAKVDVWAIGKECQLNAASTGGTCF